MIGRADIEESKSNVAMDAWLPQASYPCGNFSDTSSLKLLKAKGSIGHAFAVCIRTENQNQVSFSPFGLQEISVLFELTLGHLCYRLTDVPPQPNSPPDYVFHIDRPRTTLKLKLCRTEAQSNGISKVTMEVVVFHCWLLSHVCYTSPATSQSRTRVKLNRVFFPRWLCQARSLGCGFAR